MSSQVRRPGAEPASGPRRAAHCATAVARPQSVLSDRRARDHQGRHRACERGTFPPPVRLALEDAMRHRRSPRSSFPRLFPRLWPAIVLLIVTSGVDVAWGCVRGGVVAPRQALWRSRLQSQLRALNTGTREERLEAAGRGEDLFERAGDEAADASDPEPDEIALALLNAIEMQADDFVAWSIVDDFIGGSNPGIHLLLRDALHASSPNVRARAVSFFTWNDDAEAAPDLESLWNGGVPEWARADLITALAEQESTRYAEDFIRLTGDDDPAVALAAVEALDEL